MVYGLALCFGFLVVGLAFGTLVNGESIIGLLRVLIGGSLLLCLANAYYYRKSGPWSVRLARWAAVIAIPLFINFAGIYAVNHYGPCVGGFFCRHDL